MNLYVFDDSSMGGQMQYVIDPAISGWEKAYFPECPL